jgi:hypothetical protein
MCWKNLIAITTCANAGKLLDKMKASDTLQCFTQCCEHKIEISLDKTPISSDLKVRIMSGIMKMARHFVIYVYMTLPTAHWTKLRFHLIQLLR